ncbi:MAG TPA: phosphopantetheine-binding protein [Streptosporangiaceae bacterium]
MAHSKLADDAILAAFRRSVVAVVPEIAAAKVTLDRTLAELGCNSIDRADIVTMTMAELGIIVPVPEFGRDRTMGSLVALLRKYA